MFFLAPLDVLSAKDIICLRSLLERSRLPYRPVSRWRDWLRERFAYRSFHFRDCSLWPGQGGHYHQQRKSVWGPTQVLQWLGLEWNLVDNSISIPQAKLHKLLESLQLFTNMLPCVPPCFLASIVGKIVSLTPGIGTVSLLMSRFLQFAIRHPDQPQFL